MNIKKIIKLWEKDGEKIVKYYNKRISTHQKNEDNFASLDWRTLENYKKVCKTAMQLVKHEKINSILDVGCGTGNFYAFFKDNYNKVKYSGIDIVPYFVKSAKNKYPEIDVKVENFISDSYNPKKNDLVINLGGLNSRVKYYNQYLYYSLLKMLRCAKKIVAFNLIVYTNKNYFPKGNSKKVGHITNINKSILKSILDNLKKHYNISYKIKTVSIFENSKDAFVCIEKNETNK